MSLIGTTQPEVGLNMQQWARWRTQMLLTGTYDPNEWDLLNTYQKNWTKDTLNTLRAVEGLEPLEEELFE